MKDKIFASTLYQIAQIKTVETFYDNDYNRPVSNTITLKYPCRISRKSAATLINNGSHNVIGPQFRGYFEIDADIRTGSVITVDDESYKVGLVYKPVNHHIEVDLTLNKEA